MQLSLTVALLTGRASSKNSSKRRAWTAEKDLPTSTAQGLQVT